MGVNFVLHFKAASRPVFEPESVNSKYQDSGIGKQEMFCKIIVQNIIAS